VTAGAEACDLHLALGRVDACPGQVCPFWQDELGSCAVRYLARTERSPELAEWLLDVRRRLELAGDVDDLREARSELQALLPPGLRS
jgi:hypothetical protein